MSDMEKAITTLREQIIKGIEVCYTVGPNCNECPYYNQHDCNDWLMRDALDLIRKQEPVSGWISVTDQLPENQGTVLIVKQLKSGQRQIGLGYCIRENKHHDYATGEDRIEPYWVCGGNNNVIYWQALPDLP